jgi:hypothetical protein
MEDVPSIDDPSLVCQDAPKDVLWRRHERASQCIWIPQCWIPMRSEAVVSKANYDLLSDAVVRPTSSQELTDAVDQGIEVVLANLIIM